MMLLAIMAVVAVSFLASCASDEPETGIDYYLSLQPRTRIFARGGLPPDPKEDMIGKITLQMRLSIREHYPTLTDDGDDAAVLVACDEVYRLYLESGMKSHTECVATLYRAKMCGTIIRGSTPIKNYYF